MTARLEILAIDAHTTAMLMILKLKSKRLEAIEEERKEKNNGIGQKVEVVKKQKYIVDAKEPLEKRIRNFLREAEGVRFNEEELGRKIIFNRSDAIDFHRALLAVTYYQRDVGFHIDEGKSIGKNKELVYYYEKPKE